MRLEKRNRTHSLPRYLDAHFTPALCPVALDCSAGSARGGRALRLGPGVGAQSGPLLLLLGVVVPTRRRTSTSAARRRRRPGLRPGPRRLPLRGPRAQGAERRARVGPGEQRKGRSGGGGGSRQAGLLRRASRLRGPHPLRGRRDAVPGLGPPALLRGAAASGRRRRRRRSRRARRRRPSRGRLAARGGVDLDVGERGRVPRAPLPLAAVALLLLFFFVVVVVAFAVVFFRKGWRGARRAARETAPRPLRLDRDVAVPPAEGAGDVPVRGRATGREGGGGAGQGREEESPRLLLLGGPPRLAEAAARGPAGEVREGFRGGEGGRCDRVVLGARETLRKRRRRGRKRGIVKKKKKNRRKERKKLQ